MSARQDGTNPIERAFLSDGKLRPTLRCLLYLLVWPVVTAALIFSLSSIVGPALDRRGVHSNFFFAYQFGWAACECAAAVGAALLFRRFIDGRPAGSLGFTFRARWLRLFGIGILFGVGMQTFVLIFESAWGFARVTSLQWHSAEVSTLAYVIPLLLLAALAEEMPIRGYLFQNLSEAMGAWPALAVTSLVFAALHLANPGSRADVWLTMAGVGVAGALFCLSVMLTGSLWFALGCHFAWNLFEGPIYGFPVSGMTFGSTTVFTQAFYGPAWITGGSFGPEAGVSSLIALAVGAAFLYIFYQRGAFDV